MFFNNILIVFGGKLFIATMSLVLTPIIARLYLPEDYGEFTLFNTIVQNLVILGTLSLPLAVSTTDRRSLPKILNLSLTTIKYLSILFTAVLFVANQYLNTLFSTTIFKRFWLAISLAVTFSSLSSTLASLNIRLKRFRINTKVSMLEVTSAKLLSLIGGGLNLGTLGLVMSDILSKGINLVILVSKFPKEFRVQFLKLTIIKKHLKQYRAFPLYTMPSVWLGTMSNQIVIFLVAYLYDKDTLGQLSMSLGLLNILLNVLSNSIQPVIMERLAAIRDGANSPKFFEKMFVLLLTLSIVCFTSVYLVPSTFYTFLLGANWKGIETVIRTYCWFYFFLLIDQAFQSGFIIYKKQKSKLIFNIVEISLLCILSIYSIYKAVSFHTLLVLYVVLKIFISISRTLYIWHIKRAING